MAKIMTENKIVDGMDYLKNHARVYYVPDAGCLSLAVENLLEAEWIGLDIETAKQTDHPMAGLNPKVSRVRLVQLYDGKNCLVVDVDRVGLDWLAPLKHKQMIAHNAQFEDSHLLHAGINLENLHCSLLMARVVMVNKNRTLS